MMSSSSDSTIPPNHNATSYVTTGGTSSPFFPILRDSFEKSLSADIIVAFTQDSGLRLLQTTILDTLDRGASIRILTSDYLHITQASALQRLLDWQEQAKLRGSRGKLEIHIFESTRQSFHPKAWFFKTSEESYAFIGSSNWSFSALCTGIEWNIRIDQASSSESFSTLQASFQDLWAQGKQLTIDWLKNYVLDCKNNEQALLPLGEVQLDAERIAPTSIQKEALSALKTTCQNKRRRGLFVLATGLGKTFLSAFAAQQLQATRILFLVHRREILLQAASSFRQIFPHHTFGWCIDNRLEQTGDITFASVQKLSRTEHLSQFDRHFFDLIIIDEVHHAAASSYQKIIHHFAPQFLLGLTATPNRSDHLDILPLFDDHIIYQADLWTGIARKRLVPFQYIGRLDSVNYQSFARTDGSLDLKKVDLELQNQARMELIWKYCQEYSGKRTIFFCSNISHADFCADFLQNKGMKIVSVHSGASSAPRISSIEKLQRGSLEAITAVDLFNEGIDIPEVDRIVMLRPTSSSVLFLQQLGRGLRISTGKDQLIVLDIIGNHRSFASRIHSILSLSSQNDFGLWIQGKQNIHLPPFCSFDIELGVLDFFATNLPSLTNQSQALLEQYYFIQGSRPSLSTLIQLGAQHAELVEKDLSWFSFLEKTNRLTQQEIRCYQDHQEWFHMLERTPIKKSFKLIALQAFVQETSLSTGIEIDNFCRLCYQNIFNTELLRDEIPASQKTPAAWKKYWIKWLHSIWESDHPWLIFQFEKVWVNFSFLESETLYRMSWEILQYRFLRYSLRPSVRTSKQILGRVHKQGRLLSIRFGESLPKQISIRTSLGTHWQLETQNNRIGGRSIQHSLHHLLRETFNQNIRNIQQRLHVYLERIDRDWYIQPVEGLIPGFLDRIDVPYFRDLSSLQNNTPKQTIRLPHHNASPFNSFAYSSPDTLDFIQKNDFLLCQTIKHPFPKQLKNKYVLIQNHPSQPLAIGRIISQGSGFAIQLSAEKIPYSPLISIWGIIDHVIPMSSLMPLVGTKILISDFSTILGISETPSKTFQNIDGLSFLILKNHSLPEDFSAEAGFIFVFQKRRKYFLYLGLWYWDGETWRSDTERADVTKNKND